MTADRAPRPVRRGVSALRDWLGERPLTQILALLLLLAMFAGLGNTMVANMERVGITPGFAFLSHPANFEIGKSLIAYSAERSFGRAILVGFLNTLLVSLSAACLRPWSASHSALRGCRPIRCSPPRCAPMSK